MLSERGIEIAFGLGIMACMGVAILVVLPTCFLFYLAGICFGWGFHAGVSKHRKKSASTTKAEGR